MAEHILIIGGGIGGLACALALRRAGVEVSVYERAEAFSEAGAGVTMTPPGLRAMDALGLGDVVVELSDNVARTAFYEWNTGELLKVGNPPPAKSLLDETRVMHRTDLHQLLLDEARRAGASVHNGYALTDIGQDGDSVTAVFADGRTERGDALIGCDGLRSTVRGLIFDPAPPRQTGIVAFRALLPKSLVEDMLGPHGSVVYVGPKASFVRYTVRHGDVLNCVGLAQTGGTVEESWSTPATRAEFKAHFPGWNDYAYALIDRMPEDQLYKWPLFDREPIAEWTRGRVALLGDAAHPMLPFLGIGATMALEDAVILGRAMTHAGSIDEAFTDYVRIRQPRATEVTHASRAQGQWIMADNSADEFRKEFNRNAIMDYDVRK